MWTIHCHIKKSRGGGWTHLWFEETWKLKSTHFVAVGKYESSSVWWLCAQLSASLVVTMSNKGWDELCEWVFVWSDARCPTAELDIAKEILWSWWRRRRKGGKEDGLCWLWHFFSSSLSLDWQQQPFYSAVVWARTRRTGGWRRWRATPHGRSWSTRSRRLSRVMGSWWKWRWLEGVSSTV